MLLQKTVTLPQKLEMVIGINKTGKRIQNKNKIKNQTKNRKKGKSVFILVDSMVKHLRCWEMPKKK